ncbi:hypothetical protein J2W35_004864 [Variovorax boronicumulans]|uniref:TnsA endonuclease N-terminal domain-containing protein n=1 Tax=Variovorax boronicumulans TaxID=436515 RepID=UPI002789E928|nr:TnsA endonuclease N-terminal domain-containing protein [Variovorax boronicumulans]MDQ0084495.1 hypothetical protein [Variovorax boronicumulans]
MEPDSPAPVRKVVSRSPVRTVRRLNLPGIFDRPVECESSLERDFVLRAALCPDVARLQHQPFRLELPSGRRYTPDFLATYRSGARLVIEVKQEARTERFAEIFDQARSLLAARGIDFLVLTEVQIRHERVHERAAMVLRYRKMTVGPAVRERILARLAEHPEGLTLLVLQEQCNVARTDVLSLAAARAIRVSNVIALDDESRFFPDIPMETNHEVRLENWFDPAQR